MSSISGISSSYSSWYLSALYGKDSSATNTSLSTLLNSSSTSSTDSSSTSSSSSTFQLSGSQPPPPPPSDEQMSEMDSTMSSKILDAKDTNGDGVLSADELGISSDQFNAMDTDGDGSVSSDELTAGLKAKRQEMMAKMRENFEQNGEANDDGTITSQNTLLSQAKAAYGNQQSSGFTPDVDSFLAHVFGSDTGSELNATA